MPGDGGSRAEFETFWEQTGLAIPGDDLAPGCTITALATSTIAAAPDTPAKPENAVERLARVVTMDARSTIPTLPHLSISADKASDASPGKPGGSELTFLEVLGEGGMGRVVLAHQKSLDRHVAVKVLKNVQERGDSAGAQTLLTEARITGLLEHPSIVPVHALGRDDHGRPVMVMKRIEGVVWTELIDDPNHPAWSRVQLGGMERIDAHVEILMTVCNAIHFAHTRGIVHRDIKPDNVMIGEFGEIYVSDWGIATREGKGDESAENVAGSRLVGTPSYMAPEMLSGKAGVADARTDVFLLGATLHRVLTGRSRNEGETVGEALFAAFLLQPYQYDASVPSGLAAIANRATSVDPDARHPSALAFRQQLADHVRHQGSLAFSRAAAVRLDELRLLLAPTPAGTDTASTTEDVATRVHRLSTECRFGFEEALRVWKDNATARSAQQELLGLLIEYEIGRANATAARALLAELREPPRALLEKLTALDDAARRRAERDLRFTLLEREQDLSISAKHRTRVFAVVAVVAVLLVVAKIADIVHRGTSETSHAALLGVSGTMLATVLLAVGVGRRQLLLTEVNRRLVGLLILALSTVLLHRVFGMLGGLPVRSIVMIDMLIMAGMTAMGALAVVRRLWTIPTVYLVAAVTAALVPAATPVAFLASSCVAIALLVRVWPGDTPGRSEKSAREPL